MMKFKKKIIFFQCLCLFGISFTFAQISITDAQVSTITDAGEGDYYITQTTNKLYVGLKSGTLRLVSAFEPKDITNELFFENTSFCYISLKTATGYKVIRYDKADVNIEKTSSGTGSQPTTLALVVGLTYS